MQAPKRIKVLECIRQGQIGGGESHLLTLVENLDRSLFDPVVLSFTDGPMVSRLNALGVKTAIIPTEKPFDVGKWKQIRKWLRNEKVDLVHAHGTRANSNILWAARSLHIPVIYTVHGWSFHNDQKAWIKKVRVLGERYLTSRSTVNISVSESNKETGQKHFSSFRSIVINNGINVNTFNPDGKFKNIRQELNIPETATLVLFLARFTHQKQPVALLKAFMKAAEKDSALFLLMVGDGEEKPEAMKLLENSGMKERILLLPFRQDVADILSSADIFVLPSLWEGLPIALLEAMAMGKAIIASRVDGTREVLRHKENGYFVETGTLEEGLTAALLELGRDQGLRIRLQKGARQTVSERFNAITMTREIEKVYRQVMAN